MKKLERLELRDRLYLHIDIESILEGTIEEVSNKILNIRNRISEQYSDRYEKYKDFQLEYVRGWDFESPEIEVYGIYDESDESFENRKKRQKTAQLAASKAAITKKLKQEEEEKALYEKLKQKYK